MDLRVLVILFFIASLVKGEGGCKDLQYLDCKKDKALVGHVIKSIRMLEPGLEECQNQCFKDDRCVSYNLGSIFGVIRSCELNDADHVEYPDDVRSVPGAEYCPIKNPCSSNPCPQNQNCNPDFKFNTFRCGDYKSCAGLKRLGKDNNGVYNITPVPGYTVEVYCDQVTDGGGWTVIQKRFNGLVDFQRKWNDYKRGFGNKKGEYWLGLDAMHILTNSTEHEIRIDLKDFNLTKVFALYGLFKVASESQQYTLILGSYIEGDAGNSFASHSGSNFTTTDKDNDNLKSNCADKFGGGGGWWFTKCHTANLNGLYLPGETDQYGITWKTWHGNYYSNKESEMKIRQISRTDKDTV